MVKSHGEFKWSILLLNPIMEQTHPMNLNHYPYLGPWNKHSMAKTEGHILVVMHWGAKSPGLDSRFPTPIWRSNLLEITCNYELSFPQSTTDWIRIQSRKKDQHRVKLGQRGVKRRLTNQNTIDFSNTIHERSNSTPKCWSWISTSNSPRSTSPHTIHKMTCGTFFTKMTWFMPKSDLHIGYF